MPTIAWIEDDVDVIDSVVYPLEKEHYRIDRYRTVTEAMDHLDDLRKADLILLDMIFPPGGGESSGHGTYPGLDLLQQLREVYHITTPTIAFTVVTNRGVHDALRELGVAEIIRKPVRPSELKARVEEVIHSNQIAVT